MLDAWIIEELKKKDLELEKDERPFLELPIEYDELRDQPNNNSERGIIEIQL